MGVSYWGCVLLNDAMDIVSYVSLCIDCFNVDPLTNIARKILTYLMQQFLSGIVKGIYMMIGGVMLLDIHLKRILDFFGVVIQ